MNREIWRWKTGAFCASELEENEREAVEVDAAFRDASSLLILPPLWDHHGHLAWLGALDEEVDLRGAASPGEALRRVGEFARSKSPGTWIVGFGWDQNAWGGIPPDPAGLEATCPDRPVYLRRIDTHAAWVNAAALKTLGLSPGDPDPPGGAYQRRGGRFSGILMDRAMEPFEAHLAQAASHRAGDRLRTGLEKIRSEGLCGTTDMNLDAGGVEALRRLDREGNLPLPVDGFLSPGGGRPGGDGVAPGAKFRVLGRKLFMDGALGSRGAALEEDYSDDPGNRGLLVETAETLRTHLEQARAGGWGLAVHAIGDRALRVFLEASEGCGSTVPIRLEHLQVVREEDRMRLRHLAPVASLQPCHLLSDAPWAQERLGGRMACAYRLRTLDECCGGLLLGTDFPIEPPDPRRTLFACLTRGPGEGISLGRALEGMAPPAGRVRPGSFTLASGEPWFPGRDTRLVLEWKLGENVPPPGEAR